MGVTASRHQGFAALYALTVAGWLVLFPFDAAQLEFDDLFFSGLALGFAGGAALLVFRLNLPTLEVGWGVFTYSQLVRFLDAVAEGPEVVESVVPGSIMLAGLAIILVGFSRTTDRLRMSLSERSERLTVLNRVLRHNLSNDLTSVIGSLQYFLETADDEEDAELARMGIERAWALSDVSEKLRRVDDVLERAEREGTAWHDLATVVESTVEELRQTYPAVTFTVSTEPDVVAEATTGVADAVFDVVENACKHNDAVDPEVAVTVATEGDGAVSVTVVDNGPGIPEHELRPIRRGEETALNHGSSVSLWFVTWVVELSGGDVVFEYDGGQRVVLRFPLANTDPGRVGRLVDRMRLIVADG
jgi:signal transduction histidine kinase